MTININESFLTEKALDYAKLSDLAYATWIRQGNSWILDSDQKDFSHYNKIWNELANPETGKGYTIADHTPNDSLTGFSATIFQKDGKNILAIRGTDKTDPRDLWADGELMRGQLPAYQYESMVNYINEKMLTNFDVTGHSLGGCLAQAAKATFAGVKDVYTYNSPGAKGLLTYSSLGTDPITGKVIVYIMDPVLGTPITFLWDQFTWNKYETYLSNRNSVDRGVYNISGNLPPSATAILCNDIGSPVNIFEASHDIEAVEWALQLGKYSIDPHKPVTFIGSKANEIIDGLSLTGTSTTDPIQPLTLMGGYGNDKIYGSDGDDTLYGDMAPEVPTATTGNSGPDAKAGNDHLYGGRGNDTLIGGGGDDVYHIRCGEGNDTIEDTSGVNTIVYTDGNGMSRTLKFFYATSSSAWSTPDGKATISGNTITMEDGQTITLSGGTDLENFGIHKQDKPEDAQNFNAIAGEDDKNDTLFDTAGNDKIEGKGGCDIIAVLHGGNDWVLGGADDDDVMVKADLTGNILIEGNAGMDMIAGGGGNDRIFCEDKGEMVDLVEAGETAENLDIWGERANGMGGNDFIYGSQAKDLLLGGTGSDLVVGGSGNDALFGDGDAIYAGAGNDFISNGFSLTGTSYN